MSARVQNSFGFASLGSSGCTQMLGKNRCSECPSSANRFLGGYSLGALNHYPCCAQSTFDIATRREAFLTSGAVGSAVRRAKWKVNPKLWDPLDSHHRYIIDHDLDPNVTEDETTSHVRFKKRSHKLTWRTLQRLAWLHQYSYNATWISPMVGKSLCFVLQWYLSTKNLTIRVADPVLPPSKK